MLPKAYAFSGTNAAFVVVREKFGFVGGDVDADGTIALASFAGEAEIEGLLHFFAPPSVARSTSPLRHLPEQVSAAAGGVLFFVGGAPARAHHAAFFAAALADSDAAQRGVREAAVIEQELEVRLGLPRRVVRAEAKVLVELVGLDHFAGIHLPVGIPRDLEFAEGLHQFGAEHFRKKFGAGLSVAVLAGERSAVADDEVGGFFDELADTWRFPLSIADRS